MNQENDDAVSRRRVMFAMGVTVTSLYACGGGGGDENVPVPAPAGKVPAALSIDRFATSSKARQRL